jgi:hypothetical protein
VNRRRIQPKVAVELETVSLRLPALLGRAVERYAKYLGSSTDLTYVTTQAIEIALRQDAELQKTLSARPPAPAPRMRHGAAALPTQVQNADARAGARPAPPTSSRRAPVFTPALSAPHGGPSPLTRR